MKHFSIEEIHHLYNKHCNLPYNYFLKYENILEFINLPDWQNILPGYRPDVVDFPRIWTILDFKEWVEKHNINPVNKLLITCNDPEEYYLKYDYKYKADYEVNRFKYDLHTIDLPEKDFDFCLFSQTLEHLWNPLLAMQRIALHIKSGGMVFTSVPCMNIPHMTPIHFQGFTPMGLVMLFIQAGFEILEFGQFGSKNYAKLLYEKGWPNYKQLLDKNNQIQNEQDRPAQLWILARKI